MKDTVENIISDIEKGNTENLTLYERLAPVYDYLYGSAYDYENQASYIKESAPNKDRPLKIIEGGCGTGRLLEELNNNHPNSNILGVELHEGMSKLAEERTKNINNVHIRNEDMLNIDEECDIFTLFGVMAHVDGDMRLNFFEHVYEMLTDEGSLIFNYKHPEYDVDGKYSPWERDVANYTIKSHYITLHEDSGTYYAVSYEFMNNDTDEVYSVGELMDIYFQRPENLISELKNIGFSNIESYGEENKNGVIVATK